MQFISRGSAHAGQNMLKRPWELTWDTTIMHSFINPIYRSHTKYACAVDDLYLHVCAHEQKYIAHGPRRVDHARARAHPG